jgi:hypothetical protein
VKGLSRYESGPPKAFMPANSGEVPNG